jgi:mRNA interferase RelE/StbE
MFTIKWDEVALKKLDKLEFLTAKRIAKKVKDLQESPFNSDVIRLQGSKDFRLRVGDYRVIFSIEGETMIILKVGHRRHIYER